MCSKSMGQTDGCGRIVGRFVSKDEVGFLVWKVECAAFRVILAALLPVFLMLILIFTVYREKSKSDGAPHTSVHGGCVHNLSSRGVYLKQEAGPLKTLPWIWEPHCPHAMATPPALLQHSQL